MDTQQLTDRVDRSVQSWGPTALRWTAGLLWLANVNWKVPPDFGRSDGRCIQLCRYVEAGAEFPVVPGSSWFFENVASPNLAVFGWISLLGQALLVVLLLSGRFVRSAAVFGMAMSAGIGVAVANADHEWYWSYLLMIALHLAVLVTAATARRQTARTMALVTVGYGVLIAIVRAGAGFTGSGDWVLFSQDNDIPGQWGRATFPGSIALGLGFIIVGAATWFALDRLDQRARRILGWSLVAIAALLLLTYERGGLIIELGSRPGNVAMLAALGLAIAVPAGRRSEGHAGTGPGSGSA